MIDILLIGDLDLQGLLGIALGAAGAYLGTIVLIRLNGIHSLARMTGYDFVTTVALGAIVGRTATASGLSLAEGLLAITALFALQQLVSRLRRRANVHRVIHNLPLLLYLDGDYLEDNLRRARVSRDDVVTGMRRSGHGDLEGVAAVVIESTGDLSVLPRLADGGVDERLLEGVRR